MRQCFVLLLLWIVSAVCMQALDEGTREELMSPDVRFLKRNSLSIMMRLGKRVDALKEQEPCVDCSLGNLMRLGRR
nr:unnamed protein product [Haemonchus contortus]